MRPSAGDDRWRVIVLGAVARAATPLLAATSGRRDDAIVRDGLRAGQDVGESRGGPTSRAVLASAGMCATVATEYGDPATTRGAIDAAAVSTSLDQ